jgi:hypothetical protein
LILAQLRPGAVKLAFKVDHAIARPHHLVNLDPDNLASAAVVDDDRRASCRHLGQIDGAKVSPL